MLSSVIAKLEKEIASRNKKYEKAYRTYRLAVDFNKGDKEISKAWEGVQKNRECVRKLRTALSEITDVIENETKNSQYESRN